MGGMNRAQEIATIDAHISLHGVYRCAPGESLYGDEAIPLRDRMANFCRNKPRPYKPPRNCKQCGDPLTGRARNKGTYCSLKCSGAARRTRLTVKCATCGKPLIRDPCRVKETANSYCDSACQSAKARAHGRLVAA